MPFSGELYVEADDYREDAPKGWFRLGPGREVRLKHGYYIKCHEAIKDAAGNVVELRCTYDPESGGGTTPDGRMVQGHAALGLGRARGGRRGAAVRLSLHEGRPERRAGRPGLHGQPQPELAGRADGLQGGARCWPRARPATASSSCARAISAPIPTRTPGQLVFNRTVGLKDTWAKVEKKG